MGRYSIMPFDADTFLSCTNLNNCEWDIPGTTDPDNYPQNRLINFTHFESRFLSEELKKTQYSKNINFTGKYSDYAIGMKPECYVEQDDVSSVFAMSEKCRWVDYLYKEKDDQGDTYYYRLSFK